MDANELAYDTVEEREAALRVIEDLLIKTENDPKRREFYERQRTRILQSAVRNRQSGTNTAGIIPKPT
jgi:hypothetical protein